MINSLQLNGFKSIVSDYLEFDSLNLLTGINSSGKSSIIQALLMLNKANTNEQNFLLNGHGSLDELRNNYVDKMSLSANFSNNQSITIENEKVVEKSSNEFPKIIYIAADRFGPETTLPIFVGNNYNIGSKGENILKVIEHYERELVPNEVRHEKSQGDAFILNLTAWMGEISPIKDFGRNIQSLIDSSYTTFDGYRAKNVGFGLSYVLPVITTLLLGAIQENTTVIIENPEAHLHPKGQTEIARLAALSAQSGAQIIMETHSDHIFDGTRIFAKKQKNNFYKHIKTYWFELDKNANSLITEIEIDTNGRIDNCPQGFFDQFDINNQKLL